MEAFEDRIEKAVEKAVEKARVKHPCFAGNIHEALCILGEEYGEAVREATKQENGWRKRLDEEILDVIAVAVRILRHEYEGNSEKPLKIKIDSDGILKTNCKSENQKSENQKSENRIPLNHSVPSRERERKFCRPCCLAVCGFLNHSLPTLLLETMDDLDGGFFRVR